MFDYTDALPIIATDNRMARLYPAVISALQVGIRHVYGHGFAETIGDLSVDSWGLTYAVVSAPILQNIADADDVELQDAIRALWAHDLFGAGMEYVVITRETDNGSQDMVGVWDTTPGARVWDQLQALDAVESADDFESEQAPSLDTLPAGSIVLGNVADAITGRTYAGTLAGWGTFGILDGGDIARTLQRSTTPTHLYFIPSN